MILTPHYIQPSTFLLSGDNIHLQRQPFEHASFTNIGHYSHLEDMSDQIVSAATSTSNESSEAGSPLAADTINNESGPKNTKRRASRAGTRSVSTLTTAQLARKRANDREAQRAIRQRTKEHIESLERRIAELTSTDNPESRLDEALQRNAGLEREIQQLREQVQYGNAESLPCKNGSTVQVTSITRQNSLEGAAYTHTPHVTFDGRMNGMPMSQANEGYSTPISTAYLNERTEQYSPLQTRADIRRQSTPSDADMQRSWVVPTTLSQHSSPILSEPNFSRPSIRMTPLPQSIPGIRVPSTPLLTQSRAPWELPIRFLPPTGTTDHLLIGVLQNFRNLAMGGSSGETLIGPYQPSMKGILYPDSNPATHSNALSSALTDVLSRMLIKNLPEKAACLLIMYQLLQWQISPLVHTYDALPEWYSPRAAQLITPHPIWMDHIPWGKLRDKLINNQGVYGTEEFQQLYAANICVNWPFRPLDAFVFGPDDVHIASVFEKHILDLNNWSLGPGFAARYPELADVCRFSPFVPNIDTGLSMGVGHPQQGTYQL